MGSTNRETVLQVQHWNESLFSFTTTRNRGLRFKNGHFIMIGLEIEGKPLLRAYSLASANYEEHLEFYSIKVPNGPLTSRLQHLKPGDEVLVGTKATGTLVTSTLRPGKRLYLLSTGTGLAPFLSIIRDPETYEAYEQVVLAHGVRTVDELGYSEYIQHELPQHEYLGEQVREKLRYYPSVTREAFTNRGRLTDLLRTGKMCRDLGLPDLHPEHDRVMICGNPSMLDELGHELEERGFVEGATHAPGDYTIERAFVER
ncbi:MAG TPA: ferredoxin--NADP reductase [Polyangiaceae bacterium]